MSDDDYVIRSEDQAIAGDIKRARLSGKICPQCLHKPLIDKGSRDKVLPNGKVQKEEIKYCPRCNVRFAFIKSEAWCMRYEQRKIDMINGCKNCNLYKYFMQHRRIDLCMEYRDIPQNVTCASKPCNDCPHFRSYRECPFYGGTIGEVIHKR